LRRGRGGFGFFFAAGGQSGSHGGGDEKSLLHLINTFDDEGVG
jgi:hypothetical protein